MGTGVMVAAPVAAIDPPLTLAVRMAGIRPGSAGSGAALRGIDERVPYQQG
jgi:hypothetical protein